jgi:putative intracellular protease/amidase
VVKQYKAMLESDEARYPLSWTAPGFSLDDYNLVLLPGGHDKAVRQIIDSKEVHKLMLDYFPRTKKPSNKAVGAICHGVMVLSSAKGNDGQSVIHECTTTTLPGLFESSVYWATRAFLGDYYKTYGAGSENTEDSVSPGDRLRMLDEHTDSSRSVIASLMTVNSSREAPVLIRTLIPWQPIMNALF